jgi:hypothetical protein
MKTVRYFWVENGKLRSIEESDRLIQEVKWHKDETLKVEIWPFDLKVGPSTQIPHGKQKRTKQDWADEVKRGTAEYRRERDERPNQETLLRVNQTRTPYSQEFTKRDDARNRAYLSAPVPKRRRGGKNTSTQDDAPF